jgi:hypothetical protein
MHNLGKCITLGRTAERQVSPVIRSFLQFAFYSYAPDNRSYLKLAILCKRRMGQS